MVHLGALSAVSEGVALLQRTLPSPVFPSPVSVSYKTVWLPEALCLSLRVWETT